jgi:hypothetical protein
MKHKKGILFPYLSVFLVMLLLMSLTTPALAASTNDGKVLINGFSPWYQSWVQSTKVTLTLTPPDSFNVAMMISNDPGFSSAVWEPFSSTKEWTLLTGAGEKTVYVKFKNESGDESSVSTASTILCGYSGMPTIEVLSVGMYGIPNLAKIEVMSPALYGDGGMPPHGPMGANISGDILDVDPNSGPPIYFVTLTPGDGIKHIYASWWGGGYATGVAETTITIDRTQPSISTLTPIDTSKVNFARPTMSASYSDVVSGIDTSSIKITFDGVDKTSLSTITDSSFTLKPSSNLLTGSHTVVLSVADNAGNILTKTWTFTITKPVLTTTKTKAYWAPTANCDTAYKAWQNGEISVDYSIKNIGDGMANNTKIQNIKATTSTGTITILIPQPLEVGTINPGESKTATIVFKLPPGTTKYNVSFSVTCEDDRGAVVAN